MSLCKYIFLLGRYLGVKSFSHLENLFLTFNETAKLSKVVALFCVPTSKVWGLLFSTSLPTFVIILFLKKVITVILMDMKLLLIVILIYIFLNEHRIPFCVFTSHPYIFFGEMFCQKFYPIFDWVVCLVFKEFLAYFVHKSCIIYMFTKYFLPICCLSFNFHNSIFWSVKDLNFDEV